MIYIYGDSHASFSFKNLNLPHINLFKASSTIYGINIRNKICRCVDVTRENNSIICICYGEIDCRCHIGKQIKLGRNEDEIIGQLVNAYFSTIINNIKEYKMIIIVGIISPTSQSDYEKINGPITHEFPFVGTNEDRVRYTSKMNKLIEELCIKHNFIYFNPYSYYTNEKGLLKYELSDSQVHIGNNTYFLEKFIELYNKII